MKLLKTFLLTTWCFLESCRISVESLKDEIKAISNKISSIKHQILTCSGQEEQFFAEMRSFLEYSERDVDKLMKSVGVEIETTRTDLAEFLCEEVNQFKLEDCFAVLATFCQRFKLAIDENERRRANELSTEKRRKHKNNESPRISMAKSEPSGSFSNINVSNLANGQSTENPAQSSESISRLTPEDELHLGLMELLKNSNDLPTSMHDSSHGSLRRVGSGRRARPSSLFTETSRERSKLVDQPLKERTSLFLRDCNDSNFQDVKKRKTNDSNFTKIGGFDGEKDAHIPDESSQIQLKKFEGREILTSPSDSHFTPLELRKFWTSHAERRAEKKDFQPNGERFFSSNHHPLAIISPTKAFNDEKTSSCGESNNLYSGSSGHRKPSLLSSTSGSNYTAAYVKPLQLTEKNLRTADSNEKEEELSLVPSSAESVKKLVALKSKLPVRKCNVTTLPRHLKYGSDDSLTNFSPSQAQPRSSIPILSRNNSRIDEDSFKISPEPFSRNRLRSSFSIDSNAPMAPIRMNSVSSGLSTSRPSSSLKTRRQMSLQNQYEPRSFMRETSSSAAKARLVRAVK